MELQKNIFQGSLPGEQKKWVIHGRYLGEKSLENLIIEELIRKLKKH